MGYSPLRQVTFLRLVRTKISLYGPQGQMPIWKKIGLIVSLSWVFVAKRMADIILSRVSKLLEVFVNKSSRTAQNESKQKHPPQH